MKHLIPRKTNLWSIAKQYPSSAIGGIANKKLFDDVNTYCMFVGYPRSGHSLIGSLLDAHPEIVIAHEQGALKYIHARFSKLQLFYMLLANSRERARKGRTSGEYSYQVQNQWQGKFTKIKVIGDKQGGGATLRLRDKPELLGRLMNTVIHNVKIVHVVRNPFDNIATIYKRAKGQTSIDGAIESYFELCKTVLNTKARVAGENWYDLTHESFIINPGRELNNLCSFLGLSAAPDYLTDCAQIVYNSPHKSRHDLSWETEHIDKINSQISEIPYLQTYTFDD